MADEDEIDVLGDFSFNSCFAQNNQGIPSCSSREDTVHPQWLLDSTATNWEQHTPTKPTSRNSSIEREKIDVYTAWTALERDTLEKEMAKYGRNIRKISQTLTTKTEVEIQALIEAEYGILLDTPTFVLEGEEPDGVPSVVQEEIVMDDATNIIEMSPNTKSKVLNRKKKYVKSKNSLLKPDVFDNAKVNTVDIDPKEIFYDDDLMIGSTESIGSDMDLTDIVSKNIEKYQKAKVSKKLGNHRRKVSGSDKNRQRSKSKELMKSPQGRQRKDSSLSEESKSPRMQIILGSGQALPLSEGEQVIKIEKKKDSEPESDIEVDVDSDNDSTRSRSKSNSTISKCADEPPISESHRKFEPMPKRQKKIMTLAGDGGYTIMHTAAGDLVAVGAEPRRRPPRRPPRPHLQPVPLLPCRVYNADRPAPFCVRMHVSALISMDTHAHTSRAEVMGLLGAAPAAPAAPTAPAAPEAVTLARYQPAAAAAELTHCDMDPVSAAAAAAALGGGACGWHHSHPTFGAAPSDRDLRTQRRLQRALERGAPFLALITSQHWPVGRTASHYRCIRVEEEEGDEDNPVGYQLSVKLIPDLTLDNLPGYLEEIVSILCYETDSNHSQYMIDVANDVCPQAKMTYLEKCISSISHHMRSAGYEDQDPVVKQLVQGIRDIFR
ncbi:uncharacterized protein LOC131846301 isoform X2 [Achroia grisella]|uniref:uncharacterized protein LOC131846301 isoform X2 n=1 Tax=Achroia grisella TaxID=688607 RepID=UPI0027D2554A|nr:uncharacterized protein LOC131846301 isoform X2 [Achroia grisella]